MDYRREPRRRRLPARHQTRALADSGVNYVAVMISNSDAVIDRTPSTAIPFDNPQAFQNVVVLDNGHGRRGMFTVVEPARRPTTPNFATQPYRYGLVDKAGKINVNALLATRQRPGQRRL